MASIRRRKDRWQVQVRRKGSLAATRSFTLRADAEAWAREVELSIDRHGLPIPKKQLQSLTLGALLTRYLAEITPRKKSHVKEAYRIKRLLKSDFARLSLAHLRPHHVGTFRDQRLKTVGTQAVRHDLNLISNVFSVAAREWELTLPTNPLANLAMPPISKPRERRLHEGELERLLEAAAKVAPDYLPDLVLWLLETAMRKGEALRATLKDFDARSSTIILPETKNGHSRRVPLSTVAQEIVMRRGTSRTSHLFGTVESLLRSHWSRLTRLAHCQDLHIHDLRHEAISRLFEKGLTVPEVASVSGHRDIRQLARYAHADTQRVREKMNLLRIEADTAREVSGAATETPSL